MDATPSYIEPPVLNKVLNAASNETVEWRLVRNEFVDTVSNDIPSQSLAGESTDAAPNDIAERLVASQFMESPSQDTLNDIISNFIDATGNKALRMEACGSVHER